MNEDSLIQLLENACQQNQNPIELENLGKSTQLDKTWLTNRKSNLKTDAGSDTHDKDGKTISDEVPTIQQNVHQKNNQREIIPRSMFLNKKIIGEENSSKNLGRYFSRRTYTYNPLHYQTRGPIRGKRLQTSHATSII